MTAASGTYRQQVAVPWLDVDALDPPVEPAGAPKEEGTSGDDQPRPVLSGKASAEA